MYLVTSCYTDTKTLFAVISFFFRRVEKHTLFRLGHIHSISAEVKRII